MKLKALVAAMALAAGVAHADYPTFTDATQPSAILFSMWNSAAGASAVFDLGLNSSNFTFVNVGGVAADYVGATESLQITWNFNTGTVASTGAHDVSTLLAGVTGDWSGAWTTYSGSAAGSVYDVFAGDRDGTATTQQHYLSTASVAGDVAKTTNANLLNFNGIGSWASGNGLQGTNATATNGADVVADPSVFTYAGLYQGNVGGMLTNWNGKAPFTATGASTSELGFYALDGVAGGSLLKAKITDYNGKFALDTTDGTLTWTSAVAVTAVPEPSTYAMLFAGLGLMGFMARRRAK